MKNIQVIDGAENCIYPIYQTDDESFRKIFPQPDQNIEFFEDLDKRMDNKELLQILNQLWKAELKKENVIGIHGTLFYNFKRRKKYFPNKKESDIDLRIL